MALDFIYILSVMNMSYYHAQDPGYFSVHVSGYEDTMMSIDAPFYLGVNEGPLMVQLEASNDWSWSASYVLTATEAQEGVGYGFRIRASRHVNVQVSRGKTRYTNIVAYTALPLTSDYKEFYISSQIISLTQFKPLFIIGSGDTPASVNIYRRSVEGKTLISSRSLRANEMVEVIGSQNLQNLTGLYVTSSAPIVLYSGHQCANMPTNIPFCEPLLQFIPPVSHIGRSYMVGPIRLRYGAGYSIRVIFTQVDTDLSLKSIDNILSLRPNGAAYNCQNPSQTVTSIYCNSFNPGDFVEIFTNDADKPIHVTCSQPCYVYQFNHGGSMAGTSDKINTDPFMSLVPYLGTSWERINFSTVDTYFEYNPVIFDSFISIISPPLTTLVLDNDIVSPDACVELDGWCVHSMAIKPGMHTVQGAYSSEVQLVIQVYGHGPGNFSGKAAYGYPASYPANKADNSGVLPTVPTRTTPDSTLSSWIPTWPWTPTLHWRTTTAMPDLYTTDDSDIESGASRGESSVTISLSITGVLFIAIIIVIFFVYMMVQRRISVLRQQRSRSTTTTSPSFGVGGVHSDVTGSTPYGNTTDPSIYVIPDRVSLQPPEYSSLYPEDNPPTYDALDVPNQGNEDYETMGVDNPDYENINYEDPDKVTTTA